MTTRSSNSSKSTTGTARTASNNGVSVHFNYHGHARVTYPGASYDPTGTDVEARASVAGVDDSNEELREAEFDLSFEAKPKADKIFAAEVDKVIKALESAEKNWMTPNKCAQIVIHPGDKLAETAEKGQTGHLRCGSQIGGWRQARLRHLDGPETGERHVHPDDRALQPGEIQLHGQKSRQRNLHRNHTQSRLRRGRRRKRLDPADRTRRNQPCHRNVHRQGRRERLD